MKIAYRVIAKKHFCISAHRCNSHTNDDRSMSQTHDVSHQRCFSYNKRKLVTTERKGYHLDHKKKTERITMKRLRYDGAHASNDQTPSAAATCVTQSNAQSCSCSSCPPLFMRTKVEWRIEAIAVYRMKHAE